MGWSFGCVGPWSNKNSTAITWWTQSNTKRTWGMYCTQLCCMELFHQQLRLKPIFYWSFRPSTLLLCQQIPVYHNQHLCLQNFNFDAFQQIYPLVCLSWWHSFPFFWCTASKKDLQYKPLNMEQDADCKPSGSNFNQSTEIRQTTRSLVDSLKTRTC